jgi:hypothetical protein
MADRETKERKAKRGDTAPIAGWISTGEMMSSTSGSTGAAAAGSDTVTTASGRTSGADPGGPVAPITDNDIGTRDAERTDRRVSDHAAPSAAAASGGYGTTARAATGVSAGVAREAGTDIQGGDPMFDDLNIAGTDRGRQLGPDDEGTIGSQT